MPSQFVARNGIFAQGNSQVTGSATISGSLLNLGNVNFGQNALITGVWTIGSPLITVRNYLAGAGTQNAGLAFGGNNFITYVSCTEEYNGTVWTAGGALINATIVSGGAGTQNAALSIGGATPTIVA